MKSKKKTNKKSVKGAPEKKNLSIINQGDTVIIKNRSAIASGVLGVVLIILCVVGTFLLGDIWNMLLFKLAFPLIVLGALWTSIGAIFSKIVLNSPNKLMIVYNPFKKQYNFDDINYVDRKTKKEKDGVVVHKISAYIGDGKRTVEILTFSSEQADELESLLRGMLDSGAMVYPEGDEEPFNFDDEKKERRGLFSFGKRKVNDKNAAEKDGEPHSADVTPQTSSEEEIKASESENNEASDNGKDE
ncbi:MAG: hypothetical protein IJW53_05330 [Clostridia bacterium]|nr:hypothetical protein [Clostridia bacterium]